MKIKDYNKDYDWHSVMETPPIAQKLWVYDKCRGIIIVAWLTNFKVWESDEFPSICVTAWRRIERVEYPPRELMI